MEEELNPKQILFCRFYTQNDELFGNATLAYAEAYGYELESLSKERPITQEDPLKYGDSEYTLGYNTCSVLGSKLLRNNKKLISLMH